MLKLVKAILQLLSAGSELPTWTDQQNVEQWLTQISPPLATVIVTIAEMVNEKQPLIAGEELRETLVQELESSNLQIRPEVIEAIIQVVLLVLGLFIKK